MAALVLENTIPIMPGVRRFQTIGSRRHKMVVSNDQNDADASLAGLLDRQAHRLHTADNAHPMVPFDYRRHAPIAQERLDGIGANRPIGQPPQIEMDKPQPVGRVAPESPG